MSTSRVLGLGRIRLEMTKAPTLLREQLLELQQAEQCLAGNLVEACINWRAGSCVGGVRGQIPQVLVRDKSLSA